LESIPRLLKCLQIRAQCRRLLQKVPFVTCWEWRAGGGGAGGANPESIYFKGGGGDAVQAPKDALIRFHTTIYGSLNYRLDCLYAKISV
jgi:hypothetical protein